MRVISHLFRTPYSGASSVSHTLHTAVGQMLSSSSPALTSSRVTPVGLSTYYFYCCTAAVLLLLYGYSQYIHIPERNTASTLYILLLLDNTHCCIVYTTELYYRCCCCVIPENNIVTELCNVQIDGMTT